MEPSNLTLLAVTIGLALIAFAAKPKRPKFRWLRRRRDRADEQMRLWKLADGNRGLQDRFGLFEPVAVTYTERDYE